MKRFFCTICQRPRRVRRLPPDVGENLIHGAQHALLGTCVWHSSSVPQATMMRRLRATQLNTTRPKVATPPKAHKPRTGKGRQKSGAEG
jgi:hypothetical protein